MWLPNASIRPLSLLPLLLILTLSLPLRGQMQFQEVLADPAPGFRGDANRDGFRDPAEDAFIEFWNMGSSAIDWSGFRVRDGSGLIHTFPSGTIVAPQQALVVFGGGAPSGNFCGALVQVSSEGGLSLSNSGEVLTVYDPSNVPVAGMSYGAEGGGDASLTRFPEGLGGAFQRHDLVAGSFGAPHSPGCALDGFPFVRGPGTLVRQLDPVGITGEDSAGLLIRVGLIQPSPSTATNVLIQFLGGTADASDFSGPASTTLVFAPGTSGVQSWLLPIQDDPLLEDAETAVFAVVASGGSSASAIGDPVPWTIWDNDLTTPLILNEYHADPAPGTDGDANRDGIRDAAEDEFIEWVNGSSASLDLSGFRVEDSTRTRHVFATGTSLDPGQALVLFGGGTPKGSFSGAVVQTASSGSLGLNNAGDRIRLLSPSGNPIAEFSYDSTAAANTSMTRLPDITGPFIPHNTIPGTFTRRFTPGYRNDGSSFSGGFPPTFSLLEAFASGQEGRDTVLIRLELQASSSPASADFTLASGNPAAIGGFTGTTVSFSPGEDQPRVLALPLPENLAVTGNDSLWLILQNPLGSGTPIVGEADSILVVVWDNDLPQVVRVNEFLADPADGLAGDANADGIRDAVEDEFLEFLPLTASADLSGWGLYEGNTLRHRFPSGTVAVTDQPIVVFGGGAPAGTFGGSLVQTASEGRISLGNDGDRLQLRRPDGNVVSILDYGPEAGMDVSRNRQPDGTDGPFVAHDLLAPGIAWSPGRRTNGTPFTGAACDPSSPPVGLGSGVVGGRMALNWTPVPGSVACQVRGGPLGSGVGTLQLTGPAPSETKINLNALVSGATYGWRVRCACSLPPGPGDATPFSAEAFFTVPVPRTRPTDTLALPREGHARWQQGILRASPARTGIGSSWRVFDASGRTLASGQWDGQRLEQVLAGALPNPSWVQLRFSEATGQRAEVLPIQNVH